MSQQKFTIHETKNYSMLKHYDFNRQIDQKNLEKITKSIQKDGQKQPISITSDGYIYDGQHRFMALRSLGLPVWYCVNNQATARDLLTVNQVRKGHTTRDLVWYNGRTGNLDCARLIELQEEWGDTFSEGVIYTAYNNNAGHSYHKLIRENTYVVDEVFGTELLNSLLLIKKEFPKASTNTFARALKMIMQKNKNFKVDELISKMGFVKIIAYGKEKDLRQEIVDVYNYKRRLSRIEA